MNIQHTGADTVTVLCGDFNGLAHFITFIFHCDHQNAIQIGFHPAGDFRSIGQGNTYAVSGGKIRIPFNIHGHKPVQAQNSQRAIPKHDIHDTFTFLAVDQFYPSAGLGCNRVRYRFICYIRHFLHQVLHGLLNLGDCGHNADMID